MDILAAIRHGERKLEKQLDELRWPKSKGSN
jgi:hypothetical protein